MKIENIHIPPLGSEYYTPERSTVKAKTEEVKAKTEEVKTNQQALRDGQPSEDKPEVKPLDALPDSENMLEFVRSFNRFLRTINDSYSVHYHKAAAREYVIVKDLATNHVLSQYPSDEMLNLMARVRSILRNVFVEAHPSQVDKRV